MRTNVYATFRTPSTAQSAVGALLDHGARVEDISLVLPKDYEHPEETNEDALDKAESGITTTIGADAASGAAKGAGIGLGVGAVAALCRFNSAMRARCLRGSGASGRTS